MERIHVVTATSYAAREGAIATISGFGGPDCVKAVRLNTKGMPDPNVPAGEWSVVLECESDKEGLSHFEICILMLTSGYEGSGPHDLVKVLEFAGFKFSEKQIYTKEFDYVRWVK